MKTLREFDYDLWAIVDNGKKRYFARVKATGEETEITLDVMRLLLSQEKQMRREYAKRKTVGTVLSLVRSATKKMWMKLHGFSTQSRKSKLTFSWKTWKTIFAKC